jgi:putative phosphoribosyl transferase
MWFANRQEAGQRLATELVRFADRNPVVLALPRGGVPVAFEIAMKLNASLDVVLVRKIGHPSMPELAVGAIADGEPLERVIDEQSVAELGVSRAYLDREIARQGREIEHRRRLYLNGRRPIDIRHRIALVVDDGIATGATMRAALRAVRRRAPDRVVLAVPVAPASALDSLGPEADEIVCLSSPEEFGAVGAFYADFRPVEDEVVVDMLHRAATIAAKRSLGEAPVGAKESERH